MQKQGFVYIITNQHNNVLYIGVTSDLMARTFEHKNKYVDGFAKRYNLNKLIYYEVYEDIISAIEREKYLKGKVRKYKLDLINRLNPEFKDLYLELEL